MQYEPTTPQQDGFSMPAEFSPHQGCILIWPERPGSWKNGAAAARKAFRSVIAAIAESETVYVAVNPHSRPSAERMLAGMANVRLLDLDSDDAWARDVAPTFIRRAADGAVRGVNWRFNAWGGEVDGLYAHWEKDDAFAGGLLAVRRCGSRALIVGLTTGGVLFLLLLTIGALCFETVSLEAGGIGLLCGSLCGGAAAGILGGGGKKKPARKKRRK